MSKTDSVFRTALLKLFREIFEGPEREAYVLNPGDPGLLRQLELISAAEASTSAEPGRPPIVAHVDHIHYGLSLMNRRIAGDKNPWATADWNASWRVAAVADEQWRALLGRLREAAVAWREGTAEFREWDEASAPEAIAIVAHTAYHMGAIRQILGMVKK
jgi:hypothetical protein